MAFKPLPSASKKNIACPFDVPRVSLWKGPIVDGISYSMLTKWLQCKERFRLKSVEGWEEYLGWKYAMEYGSLFHEGLEAHSGRKPWLPAMEAYYKRLIEKYPGNEGDIGKWFLLAKMQFPIYIKYWEKHETEKGRKPVFEEQPFRVTNADGIPVTLRGKIDACFERGGYVYLQENKSKGDIDQDGISLTVDQNLQTCIYHEALRKGNDLDGNPILPQKKQSKIAGTLYNVIRRPLSDRNAPRRGKKETQDAFIARVGKLMAAEPHKHFFRWTVPMRDPQLARFRRESLIPILHQLVQWWDSIKDNPFNPWGRPENLHFRFPFGIYHSIERGYRGDYFDLLTSGSRRGLVKIDNLFPEVH